MSPADQTPKTYEAFLQRLRESHDLPVYEAIERLVQAGGEVGLSADTLVRMLNNGMTFEQLLEVIESKMQCSQQAA